MKRFPTKLIFIAVCAVSALQAEDATSTPVPPQGPPPAATPAQASERRVIEQNGLTFVLLRSNRHDNVDTEEYFLENESAESWSQMLTYQRIVLTEPMGTDRYVGWLKSHLEQSAGAPHVRSVQLGREASVFGVQYPKDAKLEEQFALVLATIPDARRPNELHLIQYVIQSHRVPVEEMELQVRRWQSRFQSQAASLLRGDAGSRASVP